MQSLKSADVAISYEVTSDTIRKHFENHKDELMEGTHFYYEINPQFNTKVIKWTLEGVYMLGFFIKSPKAKEYRKKIAKLLREQSEARFKALSSENQKLTSLNHYQKIGYKSQLAQQKEKYQNKIKALQYDLDRVKTQGLKRKLSNKELRELKKILAKDYGIICFNKTDCLLFAEKASEEHDIENRHSIYKGIKNKFERKLIYWQNYEKMEKSFKAIFR
ncbi:hypothetical protein LW135_06630 [Helicobacter sp. faydin-H20]|uniref:hypothetical protein n=1 Tax=Helicobacter anatolicus TaxID=2905874 RepID=UPI001E5F9DBD|nr:hypothetical protein [Helicobacter anatolicus]MCE3037495.1 hypothetical protein [Helicobacter anatolicus]